VVRLGLSEATIGIAVAQHIDNIMLWMALIMVLGLSVAYGLASILTRPISRLAEAARAMSRGDFRWDTPIWAKDEIGSLGTAFHEMSQELKRKEEMREQLMAKVLGAQEEERNRIARELHDETSQALTSLMVGLKFVDNSASLIQVREKTAELRALAAQTLEDVHHLATELRPSLLDDLGLVAAIRKYTREYSAKMSIKVDSHISGLGGERLPSEIEVAVFRIIQEALTNVAKYAEAKNVSVILRYQDSTLMAIIEDDGKGFDVNEVTASANEKRLGLFGMYERASLIGGKLTIESQPGAGTTIFLEVPLKLPQGVLNGQDKATSSR
jgi:signal transduction histidine kinase